ncbi:Diaminopimelate decarboxylase [Acaryochloris thomasi RCC1774]|uniref:Diaminopimelate decarboxylase n=1 Tax=Acaryochloris thomasi RCC1774 TaxID=1764569 RepID=A0A2W1JJS6_9CYAN|nr:diaminopimelate decarboxylase [Acaryochloris thomasi]PZD71745.1 Diaminopimelate decarboxylase [Acaryochloris thomasi RCC1774]
MVSVQNLETRQSPASPVLSEQRSPNQQLIPLTAVTSDQGTLTVGDCDVVDLVKQFGSPLYIVDEHTVRVACQQYRQAFEQFYPGESQVLYASKAWNCLAICALVASEGLGIDVVSGGELYTALQAGVDSAKLYLHGNNKSQDELKLAIANHCTIIADNWLELDLLVELVQELAPEHSPRVMFRMTPGIECHTHEYIRTGHLDSKFGFDPGQFSDLLTFAQKHSEINWVGLHAHIGSQIFELQPHQDLTSVIVSWLEQAHQAGLPMQELNVGGGLGIRYVESDDPPSILTWSQVVCEGIAKACQAKQLPYPKLLCEPGRSLIGSACLTAYTVGSQKTVPGVRTYLSVDGGMSDNPRPITYQSLYSPVIANRMTEAASETVTIAGKHCESGDILLKDAALPPSQPGDILVILGTGAYNYSMASNYNRLPRPAAVLVQAGEANLIVQRETFQDLIRHDCLPSRLQPV